MLEITLLLIAAAAVFLVMFRPMRKRSVSRAEEAARKAVEARLAPRDESDRGE